MPEKLTSAQDDKAKLFYAREHLNTSRIDEKSKDLAALEHVRGIENNSLTPDDHVVEHLGKLANSAHQTIEESTRWRDANRVEAGSHYEVNKEAYQQTALDEAKAAGHDVNFGGEHYPAQPVEQLEQPQESEK